MQDNILLKTEGVKVYYPVRDGLLGKPAYVKAVDGVDLEIRQGEGRQDLGAFVEGLAADIGGKVDEVVPVFTKMIVSGDVYAQVKRRRTCGPGRPG